MVIVAILLCRKNVSSFLQVLKLWIRPTQCQSVTGGNIINLLSTDVELVNNVSVQYVL